jgi:hypothetical protein
MRQIHQISRWLCRTISLGLSPAERGTACEVPRFPYSEEAILANREDRFLV